MGDTEARELKLYIDNDGDLYRRQTTYILKNLATKKAQGKYDHELAVKAFGYLADAGAKKYAKEFGSPNQPWNKMFDAGTRRRVSEALTKGFEGEFALGNYNDLLPKKYQKESRAHARKVTWRAPEGLDIAWSPVNQAYFALWPAKRRRADQQVLKVADANEMHSWLRDTYGEPYGRSGASRAHSTKASDARVGEEVYAISGGRRHGPGTVEEIYDDGSMRVDFTQQLAGRLRVRPEDLVHVPSSGGRSDHSRRRAQLDREIARVVPTWRGGR